MQDVTSKPTACFSYRSFWLSWWLWRLWWWCHISVAGRPLGFGGGGWGGGRGRGRGLGLGCVVGLRLLALSSQEAVDATVVAADAAAAVAGKGSWLEGSSAEPGGRNCSNREL